MKPYADSNFFTRVYFELDESAEADRLLDLAKTNAKASLPITWLHRIETFNAFQLHLFQARLPGQVFVTPEQAALATANFRQDIREAGFLHETSVAGAELEKHVEELSLRHTARHGFRTYDLLHVSSALLLDCDCFYTFDAKARKLAELEGLKVRF